MFQCKNYFFNFIKFFFNYYYNFPIIISENERYFFNYYYLCFKFKLMLLLNKNE